MRGILCKSSSWLHTVELMATVNVAEQLNVFAWYQYHNLSMSNTVQSKQSVAAKQLGVCGIQTQKAHTAVCTCM